MDNTFNTSIILSYCTGFRGLERGIERAVGPIRTAVYVEIEAFIIENLLAGMEAGILDATPIWSNIKTFDATPFRGKIHGIIGGYPCQPFSNAGKRLGIADSRHLWPYIQRDIKAVQPLWCFFENVAGHLSLGYDEVYRSLAEMGYTVEAGIFTAEEVGAPHQRKRLFILAIKKELANGNCFGYAYSQLKKFSTKGGKHAQRNTPASSEKELGDTDRQRRKGYRHAHELCEDGPQVQVGGPGNDKLGNANSGRGRKNIQSAKLRSNSIKQPSYNCGVSYKSKNEKRKVDQWPAFAGQRQYKWEAPQTIEPGVGSTINGYNFREDLLRAYGNSVVEQTAEIAFIELLKKHNIF